MAVETATTNVVKGIAATFYMTKDVAAAVAFYDDLLGTTPDAHVPGMFAEYSFSDGAAFGLYQSDGFYAGGTVMFEVDDVAAFIAAAVAKGSTSFGEGHIEDTPSCFMAFGEDPEGNKFIVHHKK